MFAIQMDRLTNEGRFYGIPDQILGRWADLWAFYGPIAR